MRLLGIVLAVALLAGAPVAGNAQTQPKGSEAQGQPRQAAKTYTQKEKEDYQKKVAADLQESEQKIEGLRAKKMTLSPQLKHSFSRAMIDLQVKKNAAQNKLAALKKASAKEWSKLKDDTDKAMDDLTNVLKEIEARFK